MLFCNCLLLQLKSAGAVVLAESLKEVKNIKKLNISDNGRYNAGHYIIITYTCKHIDVS